MDRLVDHPFKPFVIVFAELCSDRSAPRIAYKILDSRAVAIEKFGAGYKIGIAITKEECVKDIYLSVAVERIVGVDEIDIPSPSQDVWCTWSEIDTEEDYGYSAILPSGAGVAAGVGEGESARTKPGTNTRNGSETKRVRQERGFCATGVIGQNLISGFIGEIRSDNFPLSDGNQLLAIRLLNSRVGSVLV